MIGHYPWTYADQHRRKYDRPECEYEDLFTAEQLRAAVAEERERCARICDTTPPYPFRPSIEAAHAIRNQKPNS
jgi:hypothetical protein